MGKIFVTNDSVGFWHAAIPALRALEKLGHSVVVAAGSNAPSSELLKEEGFDLYELKNQANWNDQDAKIDMKWAFKAEKPSCIFIGCSDSAAGSEKTAVLGAKISGIPLVVLIEGPPDETLDAKIYQPVARRICVMDELSQMKLIDQGYDKDKKEKRVVITGNPAAGELATQNVVNVLKEFLN